jgi:hypothetical protein
MDATRNNKKGVRKMKKAELLKKAQTLCVPAYKSWTNERILQAIEQRKESLVNSIDMVIDHHEKWSKSYFWTPPGSASGRRSDEKKNTFEVNIHFDKVLYSYSSDVDHSCKNVYYTGTFELNDEKKNVRLFKKLKEKIVTL